MKQCPDGTWVHVLCALFHDAFYIENYQTLKIVRDLSKDRDMTERRKGRAPSCELCGGSNNLVRCNEAGCNKHAHLFCIAKRRVKNERKLKADEPLTPNGPNWNLSILLNESLIEKKMSSKKHNSFYRVDSSKIVDFIQEIGKVVEDSGLLKKEGELKKRGKGRKKEAISKIDDETMEQILSKLSDDLPFIKVESTEGMIENALYELKTNLSKKLLTECTMHRTPERYCKCNNPMGANNSVMVGCDACGKF